MSRRDPSLEQGWEDTLPESDVTIIRMRAGCGAQLGQEGADGNFIPSFSFHVTQSERYILASSVSSSPVERGAPVSDHITLEQDKLEIQGIVTDTPIYLPLQTGLAPRERLEENLSFRLVAQLKAIHKRSEIITVATRMRIYRNMVIKDIQVERSAEIGQAVRLLINFVEYRLVDELATEVDAEILAAGVATEEENAGDQNSESGEEEERTRVSWLEQLRRLATGQTGFDFVPDAAGGAVL